MSEKTPTLEKTLTVERVQSVNRTTFALHFTGDCVGIRAPGQFMNIRTGGFLRRPISIWDWDDSHVSILFKVVGQGTRELSRLKPGDTVQALMPLGNGFDPGKCRGRVLLCAGGIGMPPVYALAKALVRRGIHPQVALGFNTDSDILPYGGFRGLGLEPVIATADGSFGKKGLITDVMREMDFDYVCACGPKPMLRAVYDLAPDGQFSFEERMGCGFGACMGCSTKTKNGYKRICKDGPILYYDEIIW